MGILFGQDDYVLSAAVCIVTILSCATACYWFSSSKFSHQNLSSSHGKDDEKSLATKPLTALQQHVLFWDRDCDNIIYPQDVYNGFRDIGFSVPFSITALLIPVFFSYPTRLGHSFIPDPLFRIYVDSIQKAKHGSDTGAYDLKGNFRPQYFEDMFTEFDPTGTGSLGTGDLWRMSGRNRVAADLAGWIFAAMEWSTTWLLLQRDGRVWKNDLRQCYDGTLFWQLRKERLEGKGPRRGYGVKEFFQDTFGRPRHMLKHGPASDWCRPSTIRISCQPAGLSGEKPADSTNERFTEEQMRPSFGLARKTQTLFLFSTCLIVSLALRSWGNVTNGKQTAWSHTWRSEETFARNELPLATSSFYSSAIGYESVESL